MHPVGMVCGAAAGSGGRAIDSDAGIFGRSQWGDRCIAYSLRLQLRSTGYHIYLFDVKVTVPKTTNFYYPDLFITAEESTDANAYCKSHSQLIVEILTPATYVAKTGYKYIAYTTIPSLNYYLLVEPETVYVVLHSKNGEGKWEAMTHTQNTDVILLPLLGTELP